MSNLTKLKKAIGNKTGLKVVNIRPAVVLPNTQGAYKVSNPPPAASVSPHQKQQNVMRKVMDAIRKERMLKGWTQRDLARESGMSQGTITRAEVHGWISIGCLIRISNALGKELTLV